MARFDYGNITIPAVGTSPTPLSKQLNFAARSVSVDNFTSQWLLIRGINHYVEPYSADAMLPLDGSQVADIVVAAPPGFPQAPQVSGETANFVFFEEAQPWSPGTSVTPYLAAGAGRFTAVGSKGLASGADTLTTLPVPPGTKTLAIVYQGPPPLPAGSYVVGGTTSAKYLITSGILLAPGQQIVAVNASADSTYVLSWAAGNSCQVTIWATELALPGETNIGQQLSSMSFPVVLASDQTPLLVMSGGQLVSYSAAVNFALAAAPTDVWTLTNPGSKIVRLTRLAMTITATTAVEVLFQLLKRSTLDTGGTFTNPAMVPHDSADTAATAQNAAYTANPTALGTLVGAYRVARWDAGVGPIVETQLEWTFGNRPNAKSPVLRNATENLALNLGGTAITAGALAVEAEWTEAGT